MDHLTPDHYVNALRDGEHFAWLHRLAHAHLLATCAECREIWRRSADLHATANSRSREVISLPPPLPADHRTASLEELEVSETLLSLTRKARRLAREDLALLFRLPQDKWRSRVTDSRSRLRSRAFAELLIDQSKERVRTAPREAAALAALVAPVLDRSEGRLGLPWARILVSLAEAHRANAVRVAGDLQAASTAFATLRRKLSFAPLADPEAEAEIHGLEASLAIGCRDFPAAEALLRSTLLAHREVGDTVGEAQALVQLANLCQTLGRPAQVPPLLEEAATLFDREKEPYLYFCTVQGRVNALLDLDRPEEAGRVLDAEREVYLASGDRYTVALYGALTARVDLGVGRLDAAVAGFAEARDQLLALDRDYDAVLACLYLADAMLAAGQTVEARKLATELVPLFRARGVAPETLASLQLLAQAAASEAMTSALVAEVRSKLSASPPPVPAERPGPA